MSVEMPEIKIVRHVRARKLRLRVEPASIRLTVPLFCSKKQIQQFLAQSEQWLIETWNKQHHVQSTSFEIPSEISFFNREQPFQIVVQKQHRIFQFDWENSYLFIKDQQPYQALQNAVIAYAKQELPVLLSELSQKTRLSYAECAIRRPKTRWGSCSSQHNIMLHAGLVLMPAQITRYVCIHELAHTKHFDHSPAFWAEVAKFDPNYMQHRRQLKGNPLPAWWYVTA
ncbi:SprT family zinc-dependent metalloprotease [Acinetobacter baumannii]|jgi:predicted metal-dependent hydrolase|uniref:YgjP family zinc-dependent metalloprotease n=1 Tax=Acinetobacter TaxID=469 RepID=UPI00070745C7|nr:SprT family zinc-dependent metalloprotease [Acinetobacter baumannii]EHU1306782.1 M48 family metallopeptidase [Acinetobacter baumannii]EHU1429485.1 M48 family metallopeptidase [Acinetobacter baumannii]EHU2159249.1 M48 family metallopeptidase [Acinetobacter baumannii]EHU2440616.1 M48 family metallopeptidase [Acinetobacter baumannii]EIB6850984.1 M48 family metallopeptidase [Acinetobacter baumannii]